MKLVKEIVRDLIRFGMVLIVLCGLIYFFYPLLRYEYTTYADGIIARIDRFNGQVDRFTPHGWIPREVKQ